MLNRTPKKEMATLVFKNTKLKKPSQTKNNILTLQDQPVLNGQIC